MLLTELVEIKMINIAESYDRLAESIKEGKSIAVEKTKWRGDNAVVRAVKKLFHLEEWSTIKICKVASEILDDLESGNLFFNGDSQSSEVQKKKFRGVIKVAEAAYEATSNFQSEKAKSAALALRIRIISLKYRLEGENGGLEKKGSAVLSSELRRMASEWKKNLKIFPEVERKLYPIDIDHLKEASRYSEFIELLMESPSLQEEFFTWTLKYCIAPEPFIEYYAIAAKLKNINLAARIGRYSSYTPLRIEKERITSDLRCKTLCKALTLPFNNKRVSILRENQTVALRGLYPITIATIFRDFANKNKKGGDFEFFMSGIELWNNEHWGYYDPALERWIQVDLTKERWWESELIPVEEIVEKEDLMQRYAIKEIGEKEWLVIGRSTRQSTQYRIDDCHGFSEVFIPQGEGRWRLYSFGKYAKVWPQDPLGALAIVGATVPAFYAYPDPNTFYSSFRQQAAFPLTASEEEGLDYMEETKKYIIAGWRGWLDFMFAFRNCSYTPQTIMEKVFGTLGEGGRVPNFFISDVTTAESQEPLGSMFRLAARSPESIKDIIIALFERLLLSFRGFFLTNFEGVREFASLANSPFRRGLVRWIDRVEKDIYHHIYLPSNLFRRIINKDEEVKGGVIWAGHQRISRRKRS